MIMIIITITIITTITAIIIAIIAIPICQLEAKRCRKIEMHLIQLSHLGHKHAR